MTKNELREALSHGIALMDLLDLSDGQECLIYKADEFQTGNEIVYVPDIFLNELTYDRPATTGEQIDDILSVCYTGNDFLEETNGDEELAERLFWYVDWQHPCSALPEVEDDE